MGTLGWIGFIGASVCVPIAAGAQSTASINLRGIVPETTTISLAELKETVSTDLRVAVTDALVARVREQSNSGSGYMVTLVSESARYRNQPVLGDGRGAVIPYIISYGGEPLRFVQGRAEITRERLSRGEVRSSELRVSIGAVSGVSSGEYSDKITIVVLAR